MCCRVFSDDTRKSARRQAGPHSLTRRFPPAGYLADPLEVARAQIAAEDRLRGKDFVLDGPSRPPGSTRR